MNFEKKDLFILFVLVLSLVAHISGLPYIYFFLFQVLFVFPFLLFNRGMRISGFSNELFFLAFFLLSLIVTLINNDYRPLFLPVYLYFSYLFSDYILSSRNKSDVFLVLFLIYATWFVVSGVIHGFHPMGTMSYMIERSRNTVSWISIAISMLYYISLISERKTNLPLLVAYLSFVISVICFGRSGVLISFCVLGLVLFQRNVKASLIKQFFSGMLLLFFLILLMFSMDLISEIVTTKTNFSEGLESPRNVINEEYMDNMNLHNMLLGFDPENIPMVVFLGGNVHNSLIYFHSRSGLAMIFFFVVFIGRSLSFWKKDSFIFMFGVLVLFLLRTSLDIVAFPGTMDFTLIYILLVLKSLPNRFKFDWK
ncbi:hypothetical protein [Vibrio toranzoniae]|uniref:hypothetical protein n=1 Tax=Vibrio toranzoniae TaxID=1194427 RepID=UPI001378C018|nr:hypothetical protein [Vibrio toranzoniae]